MQVIDSFRGEYSFLSIFHKCRVEFEGTVYPSVEHAFQAAKNPDPEYRSLIAAAGSPVTAKRMSKKTQLRPDWEEVKEGIMLKLLRSKFSDPALLDKLLATGDAELIEGNNHWDRYWGVCRVSGLNKLGKLLMQVREEITNENKCGGKKMCDVSNLFCKSSVTGKEIEGYLGKPEDCKILFVLREPHEDDAQHFWFKEDVVNCKSKSEEKLKNRYFKSLGTLAYRLLVGECDYPSVGALEEALRKCAYINIYPFSGESEASSHYVNTLKELEKIAQKNTPYTNEPVLISSNNARCYSRIAMNRYQIINNPNWKILITVCGAFEAITGIKKAGDCPEGIKVRYKSSDNVKKFRQLDLDNRKIISYYHPSHACSCNVEKEYLHIPDELIIKKSDR